MSDTTLDEALLGRIVDLLGLSDPSKRKLLALRLQQLPETVANQATLLRESPTKLYRELRKICHNPASFSDALKEDGDAIHRMAWLAAEDLNPSKPGDALSAAGGGNALVASHVDDHEWIRHYAGKALEQAVAWRQDGLGGARRKIRVDHAVAVVWLALAYHELTGKHPTCNHGRLAEHSGLFVEFCLLVLPIARVRLSPNSIAHYVQGLRRRNGPLRLMFAHIYEAPLDD